MRIQMGTLELERDLRVILRGPTREDAPSQGGRVGRFGPIASPVFTAVLAATMLMQAPAAHAGPTDAEKCEADKLKRAGKYAFCRMKAESKAVKKGEAPDYSKCDAKLGAKFSKAELKWGTECLTLGDVGAVQGRVSRDTDDLALVLAGGELGSCGDGILDAGEQCDGADIGGATCGGLIANTSGHLSCTADCQYDVSGCVSAPAGCGDGVADLGESCDGSDLRGETCATLGYSEGGLACDSECRFDQSACKSDDVPSRFRDNGDGTATDLVTGLQWEVKTACPAGWKLEGVWSDELFDGEFSGEVSQDGTTIELEGVVHPLGTCTGLMDGTFFRAICTAGGGLPVGGTVDCGAETVTFSNGPGLIGPDLAGSGVAVPSVHDVAESYSWNSSSPFEAFDGTAKTDFLDVLNDVAGGGQNCLADICDWRLPTLVELKDLLLEPDSAGACGSSPCVSPDLPGETASAFHWSSASFASNPSGAWGVSFNDANVTFVGKPGSGRVRAVRGGY